MVPADAAPVTRQGGATVINRGGAGGGGDPRGPSASASMAHSHHHLVPGSSGISSTESGEDLRSPAALTEARRGGRKRTEGGGGETKAEAGAEKADGFLGSPSLSRRPDAAAAAAAAPEATRKQDFRHSRQAGSESMDCFDSAAGGSSTWGDLD